MKPPPDLLPDSYEAGCNLTAEVVRRYRMFGPKPEFAMPAKGIAFIASLADVGHKLARNEAAHQLVRDLMTECKRQGLGDAPTVLMLQVCLERYGIATTEATLAALGMKGYVIDRNAKGSA